MTVMANDPDHDAYETLRRGNWFGRLHPSLAKALFDAGRIETYEAGMSVFHEGVAAQGLFGLVEGSVHFTGGQRILLHVATPGYWFGETASTAGFRTSVNTRAFCRVRAWRVPVISTARLMVEMPQLLAAFHQLIAMRLESLLELVCTLRKPSVLAQVAGRLVLLDRSCKECDSAVELSVIHMTQSDLADMTGHVRQTVNATIKRLEREELIRIGNRQIAILDPSRLERYAMD